MTKSNLALSGFIAGLVLLAAEGTAAAQGVPDGARVSLSFDAGPLFVLGDVIEMTFTLSNAGPASLGYSIGGRHKITVADEQQAPLQSETLIEMGGIMGFPQTLVPGNVYRQLLRLQNYVQVNRPGTFRIQVTHDFGWQSSAEKPLPVATATITVALPTPAQALQRVRTIASNKPSAPVNELGYFGHDTEYRYLSHPVFLPGLEQFAAAGQPNALEGIHRIETLESTRSLTSLLNNSNIDVVFGAALFLSRRMPARMMNGEPRGPGEWLRTPEEQAVYATLWLDEASAPLRLAAKTLMRTPDVRHVRTGAFIIESIGAAEDGALVLEALAVAMKASRTRDKPDDDITMMPGGADAMIAALAGLRKRGYRAPASGGVAVLAQILEWADLKTPRRSGWEETLEAFITQNSPLLRELAVRALPKPLTGRWEQVLLGALNDRDRGVMEQACITAGESGNMVFAKPLANIVRTEHHAWVVRAASGALTRMGAHAAAVDAWIERLSDEKLHYDGLRFLAGKLEHPKSSSGGGRTDMPREARVVMREKWQLFFSDVQRMAMVQAGQPVPVTEDQARDLFSGIFAFDIEGHRQWPSAKD